MTGTELTAEELEQKKKEEEASSQKEEKTTSATSTSQQQDQLTDAQKLRIFEIQQKTVREQGARLSNLQKEFDELKVKREEEIKPTQEESAKAFYQDPVKMMKEALAEAIAPLNRFKDKFESDSEYDKIKRGLKANPTYAEHLSDPQFEAIVDELISEGQKMGGEVSENMVLASIKHTIGSIAVGEIVLDKKSTKEDKTETESKEEKDKVIPPYLQSSSPPFKTKGREKEYRDLTENEARLAKERGMSKEQYLEWLVVDSNDVIDSKIGMKKEEEKK